MVHTIQDMPAGTVGLRVTGELTRDDYRGVIEPALRDAVASGEADPLSGLRPAGAV